MNHSPWPTVVLECLGTGRTTQRSCDPLARAIELNPEDPDALGVSHRPIEGRSDPRPRLTYEAAGPIPKNRFCSAVAGGLQHGASRPRFGRRTNRAQDLGEDAAGRHHAAAPRGLGHARSHEYHRRSVAADQNLHRPAARRPARPVESAVNQRSSAASGFVNRFMHVVGWAWTVEMMSSTVASSRLATQTSAINSWRLRHSVTAQNFTVFLADDQLHQAFGGPDGDGFLDPSRVLPTLY